MYTRPKKVLVVSQNYDFKQSIISVLVNSGFQPNFTPDLESAIVMAREEDHHSILVDYKPDFMGDDDILRFYAYGGATISNKQIVLFTDFHRPTYSIRGKPVSILGTSAVRDRDLVLNSIDRTLS